AYEADPDGFAAGYSDAEADLAARIDAAQRLLPSVRLPDSALMQIAEVCASFEVDGMRADIVTARTAVAHAAWAARDLVSTEDIRVAARLALPHRRRRNPFDAPGIDEDQLDQALSNAEHSGETPPQGPDDDGPGTGSDAPSEDGQLPAGNGQPAAGNGQSDAGNGQTDRTVGAGRPYHARLFTVSGHGAGEHGKRSRAITDNGRTVGVHPPSVRTGAPHLVATVRAAAPHQRARGRTGAGLRLKPQDLRFALREGREGNLILFCVDASGSMGARQRMREVKSAVLSLLLDAYQRRDKVGMVTFRGGEATLALPPTNSVEAAAARLDALPTGGRTPLAEGLLRAADALRVEAVRDSRRRPLLVVVTDGRATHGVDAVARSHAAAGLLDDAGTASVVMDCETGRMRLGLAAELATRLGGEHVPLGEVAAGTLAGEVRARTKGRAA
ncbi:MAG: VWA domain-containing protein, partial [Pseudonocardiaceae bacterium]